VLQVLPLFIAAVGLMLVLVVAQIDLSATSIMAMASVVAASLMTDDGGYLAGSPLAIPAAVLAFLVIGAAIGALNGACVAYFGMPSFLVSLTTMMFFSGAAIWYTAAHTDSGSSIGSLPDAFLAVGYGRLYGVPYALVIAVLVGVGVHVMLRRTVLGRWLFAVGLNPRAAAVSGVPVMRVILFSFILSGLLSALAAIIYTGRLEAGTPVLGQRILLDVIGAAVIGGVSLFGGAAKVSWVLFGVLFLTVVDNGLQLLGLSLSSVYAIKGGVILFAAVTDAVRHRLIAQG
jgi:ribose/xylose/arabinose/galactoside ABC-type transport system permease subunit